MDNNNPDPASSGRRDFLKGALGVGIGMALFSVGALDRLVRFFNGPKMTPRQEARILGERLARHNEAAEAARLEMERLESEYLPVSKLADLSPKTGAYFYDYQMRPALAFLGEDELPLLISAKCTHLGCTVSNSVDAHNQILCPCHLSHFDVRSGKPANGPAVLPLPHLGWVLKDPDGNVVASRNPDGTLSGKLDPAKLKTYTVFIAAKFKEEGLS